MESFDEFYWKHNDCLNKDTSLAHSFGKKVWLHKQQEVDELREKIKCYEKLTLSLRNEFDSWSDDTESFDAIEVQIEILESLKGENHESRCLCCGGGDRHPLRSCLPSHLSCHHRRRWMLRWGRRLSRLPRKKNEASRRT